MNKINQLKVILSDVENYINTSEKVSKTIDEQQEIIETIDDIFELLYSIKDNQSVKSSILGSRWSKTKDNVKELSAFIIQVIKTDFLYHPYILDLLLQLDQEANESNQLNILIPTVTKQLLNQLDESRMTIYGFIYNLYKREIISKDELYDKLTNYVRFHQDNLYLKAWFLPEIEEIRLSQSDRFTNGRPSSQREQSIEYDEIKKFLMSIERDRYKKIRDSGEPDDELTKAIRRDDVDTVQRIISSSGTINFSKSYIPFNIFECYVPNGTTRYINYAAAYGSVKCFKYFLLNHDKIDKSTFSLAVYGGNIEIIKIVDQNEEEEPQGQSSVFFFNSQKPLSSNNDKIIPAIMKHRNDLFDWIFEQKFTGKESNVVLLGLINQSISNGNAHSLIEIIDKGFNFDEKTLLESILNSAGNGFYLLTQLIFNLAPEKILPSSYPSNLKMVIYDNISIFSIFSKKMNQIQLEDTLISAVRYDLTETVKFFFEKLDKSMFRITSQYAFALLKELLIQKNILIFCYVIDKIDLEIFNDFYELSELLQISCRQPNFEAFKKIADIIIDKKESLQIDSLDFSDIFVDAAASGSNEICKYFIEKKLPIKFEKLSSRASELESLDADLFSLIINNVSSKAKERIIGYFDKAIEAKNKEVVKLLIKENPSFDHALFLAVNSRDLELVEIILEQHSEPSYINKIYPIGTALSLATFNDDLCIVEKLLSIPGIDPNLHIPPNETPLIIATRKNNLEILNAILNFYGDDLQNQKSQINDAIIYIISSNLKTDLEEVREKKELILKRLIETKCFNPNIQMPNNTLLTFACESGDNELVQNLLKCDDIDVNLYKLNNGDTPFIVGVRNNNLDMIKLLIEHPATNINQKNYLEETALVIAVMNKSEDIVNFIINNDKFNAEESCLNYAFYLADYEMSKILSTLKSLDVNYLYLPIPKYLLSYIKYNKNEGIGISQNYNQNELRISSNNNGIALETTLINAVNNENINKIDLIVQHHSFDKDKSQIETAVSMSLSKNKVLSFKKLINIIDIDINIVDVNGNSLLCYAVLNRNNEIINEILSNPNFDSHKSDILSVFILSYTNFTHYIFNKAKFDEITFMLIMKELYDYDKEHDNLIDLTKLLPNGHSFFTEIEKSSSFDDEIIKFFLERGADPNEPDRFGIYPLQQAITIGSTEFVKALIDSEKVDYSKKIPVQEKKNTNYFFTQSKQDNDVEKMLGFKYTTYLHLAASRNNQSILSLLLDNNVLDVNILNDCGETPLMVASRYRISKNIEILLDTDDIDYNYLNNEGKDALGILNNFSKTNDKNEYRSMLIDAANNKRTSVSCETGFTFNKTNQGPTATAATTGFTFNKTNQEPTATAATSGFTFNKTNQEPTATAATSGFSFNKTNKGPTATAATTGFSFNKTNKGPTATSATTGFTFNKTNQGPTATSATTGFTFNKTNQEPTATAATSGFTFNKTNQEPTATSATTGFTFNKTNQEPTATSATTGFTFNKTNQEPTATAATSGFTFNKTNQEPTATSATSGFTFNKTNQEPTATASTFDATENSRKSDNYHRIHKNIERVEDPKSLSKIASRKAKRFATILDEDENHRYEMPNYQFMYSPQYQTFNQNEMMNQHMNQWLHMIQVNNANQAQFILQMMQQNQLLQQQMMKKKKRSHK